MGKLFAYLAFLASAYNKARYPQRFSVPDSEGVQWKVHERQMSRQELKTKQKKDTQISATGANYTDVCSRWWKKEEKEVKFCTRYQGWQTLDLLKPWVGAWDTGKQHTPKQTRCT